MNYGLCFLSVVKKASSCGFATFGFATNQGKARQKDNIREGMVGHQIVVSKNKALRRVRGIANLSGFSAELIVRRSCCWKGHSTDSRTSRELKLRRNEHAVRRRPT